MKILSIMLDLGQIFSFVSELICSTQNVRLIFDAPEGYSLHANSLHTSRLADKSTDLKLSSIK